MSDPVPSVDWTDPCSRATALRAAYYTLLSGQQETEIRTRTLDTEEMVRFASGNLDVLRSEMQDAQDACAAFQAGKTQYAKRFAITARFKRHPGRYDPFRGCY